MRCLQSYNLSKLVDNICIYFGNPYMYKIKDEKNLSWYGIQIISDSIHEKKFVICKCEQRSEERIPLKNIPWFVLQTRTIEDIKSEYDTIPKYFWEKNHDSILNHLKVEKLHEEKELLQYGLEKCPCVNLSIIQPKSFYISNDSISVQKILDSFQSIIYINKELLNI